jgi:hypothetical protein
MSTVSGRAMLDPSRSFPEGFEKCRLGIRDSALVAVLVLVAACSDSLGVASYDATPQSASSQETVVQDATLNERGQRRIAPLASSDAAREVPAQMRQVGTSADDGGYHYYEPSSDAR